MLAVVSPAKTFTPTRVQITSSARTTPVFVDRAAQLIENLKRFSSEDLVELMGINDKLALTNVDRYHKWKPSKRGGRPALFAFGGDVYRGLQATAMTPEDVRSAQRRIRILSGLYGLLKPMDVIHPYRLEMGTEWGPDASSNLYHHWRPLVTSRLSEELDRHRVPVLVNLASDEYTRAIDFDSLQAKVVTCRFLQKHRDGYRFMSFYGKRARGLMARHIVRHRIETLKGLKAFDDEGYYLSRERSDRSNFVFLRDEAPV